MSLASLHLVDLDSPTVFWPFQEVHHSDSHVEGIRHILLMVARACNLPAYDESSCKHEMASFVIGGFDKFSGDVTYDSGVIHGWG